MAIVRTVTGDIDTHDLGTCYAHEHLLIVGGMFPRGDRDFLLDDPKHAVEDLREFTALGGHSVADLMPCGLGRDPEGLRRVSAEAGVSIIAATGFHTECWYDTQHWLYHYSAEQIAELFRQEIDIGMDQWGYRGPLLNRSSARAGVIKVATGYYTWKPHTEKWFEAAAMAHLATGASIASHTEDGVLGDKQADTLLSHGVSPDSIIIGHIDKNADPYVHRDLAARGVFLEYDGPSRLKYGPDSDVVKLIAAAAEGGYSHQILLGMDLARRSYYPSYGGGPGLGYLLGVFAPRLEAEGLGDVVRQIFVENPARAFALTETTA
ncbi:MAG: aryldialkylphosphatase [Actinomycetota bacterium]|nr:aryldialkylphosphatase [Actinomycetota bacterium]